MKTNFLIGGVYKVGLPVVWILRGKISIWTDFYVTFVCLEEGEWQIFFYIKASY